MKKLLYIILAICLTGLYSIPLYGQEDPEIRVPLRFDHYYTYEQVGEALTALHQAFPQLTTLEVVGKSDENRDIWALTVNNPKTGAALDKPGVYVDGNIHGNEIQASEVCLYLLNTLLTKYGKNDKITEVVDKNVFYVIPSVNVDGRYHFFNDPNTSSTNRGLRIPKDDDKDGLVNEDYPDDLDGDGNICMIRKKSPLGNYKTHPQDDRVLIPVKPGEKGEYLMLGMEGIDNDNDGRINEDSEGYVDGNRNWGYNWAPPYVQAGSGDFPLEGKGIKAIAEWMQERPNIILMYAFHNTGGMFLRGPSLKSEGEFPAQDIAVFDYLGKNSEKIVPGYRYLIGWKDLYSTYGDFTEFSVKTLGCYGYVGELFVQASQTYKGPSEKGTEEDPMQGLMGTSSKEPEYLDFNDHVALDELYKDWTPFDHPVYGEVEIGGWVKMSSRLPHPFMLNDLVHRNAAAVIFSAEQTPEVEMEVFEKEEIGKDLWKVRVRLKNDKVIPSMSYTSVQKKIHRMDLLSLTGSNARVVSGGKLLNKFTDQVEYKEHKPEIQFIQVPGAGHVEYQFLVQGKGNMSLKYESLKAGKINKTIELQ